MQDAIVASPHGEARARLLLERLERNVVDASIFVQCVALTLCPEASAQRGAPCLQQLGLTGGGGEGGDGEGGGSSGGDGGGGGVRAAAAAGSVAVWIDEHRVDLTLQLMGAIKVGWACSRLHFGKL